MIPAQRTRLELVDGHRWVLDHELPTRPMPAFPPALAGVPRRSRPAPVAPPARFAPAPVAYRPERISAGLLAMWAALVVCGALIGMWALQGVAMLLVTS